jgi:hypothetical protein
MNSIPKLKETLTVLQDLFTNEQDLKLLEQQFSYTVESLKYELLKNLLSHLILEKRTYLVEVILINERVQLLYMSMGDPKAIDEEFQKKYVLENKIEKLVQKIEIIKNLM